MNKPGQPFEKYTEWLLWAGMVRPLKICGGSENFTAFLLLNNEIFQLSAWYVFLRI